MALIAENSWLQHAIELPSQSELERGDTIALPSLSCLKAIENIPSTADALLLHAKQPAYQASVWTSSQDFQQNWPKPEF